MSNNFNGECHQTFQTPFSRGQRQVLCIPEEVPCARIARWGIP